LTAEDKKNRGEEKSAAGKGGPKPGAMSVNSGERRGKKER